MPWGPVQERCPACSESWFCSCVPGSEKVTAGKCRSQVDFRAAKPRQLPARSGMHGALATPASFLDSVLPFPLPLSGVTASLKTQGPYSKCGVTWPPRRLPMAVGSVVKPKAPFSCPSHSGTGQRSEVAAAASHSTWPPAATLPAAPPALRETTRIHPPAQHPETHPPQPSTSLKSPGWMNAAVPWQQLLQGTTPQPPRANPTSQAWEKHLSRAVLHRTLWSGRRMDRSLLLPPCPDAETSPQWTAATFKEVSVNPS